LDNPFWLAGNTLLPGHNCRNRDLGGEGPGGQAALTRHLPPLICPQSRRPELLRRQAELSWRSRNVYFPAQFQAFPQPDGTTFSEAKWAFLPA
jgi:hypothetical protein